MSKKIRFIPNLNQTDHEMVKSALRRGATRRDVIGLLVASGATIMAAGSIVTSAQQALATTPKKGGYVKFAWDQHGPSDTLDPGLFTSSLDYARGRLLYNNLCRFNEDLTVGPELATEWSLSSDALQWTFNLRKGVMWHDGSPFTADDVVYSMMRHIGAKSSSKVKVLVSDIKEWKKLDNHTVRATLNSPNAELPVILGTFHFKIVKDGTTDFQNPVGTGPYILKEFKPGIRSIHDRDNNYWNTDHDGPYIERFEAFGIGDAASRVNALIAGDIQMCGTLDPKAIGQIADAEGVETFSVPSGLYTAITAMVDREPGNNPDFVRALKHLQRRTRILKLIQKGAGTLGNDQPVGPAYGAEWCKSVNDPPIHSYDPDKARSLLKKSGLSGAILHMAEVTSGATDLCLMLQRECEKIGFNLQLKKVPSDGYWGTTWMKHPMFVSSWNMRPSANMMMTLAFKSDSFANESRWKNEHFDKLLTQARAEVDPAKRYEMNCEMQKICSEGSGTVIPTHGAYLDAKASNLKGFPQVPLAAFGGMEWPEFIWLDS